MTGLLHISDRLLAGELSRVEAARGTLQPLPDRYETESLVIYNIKKYFIDIFLTKVAKMFTIYAYDFDINSTSPGIAEKKYIER